MRWHHELAALGAAAVLATAVLAQGRNAVNSPKPDLPPPNGPALTVRLEPAQAQTLVGASISLRVSIQNSGGDMLELADADAPSPVTYLLRERASGKLLRFSAEDFTQRIFREPPPPLEVRQAALRPGDVQQRDEDLVEYAITPPPAGQYTLQASVRHAGAEYTSEAAALSIVPPRALALAAAFSGDGRRFGSVLLHQATADGAVELYQRDSFDNNPAVGVLRPRAVPAGVGSVALATDVDTTAPYRWIAWTAGDQVQIAQAWDRKLLFTSPPAATGLREARMLPVGWALEKHTALFLVAGSEGGRGRLRLVMLAQRKGPTLREVDLAASLPAQLVVGLARSETSTRFWAVWVEATATGGSRVLARSFTPAGVVGEPRVLTERPQAVLALALPAVMRDAAPTVSVLLARGSASAETVVRLPLEGEAPGTTLSLPSTAPAAASEWALEAGVWPPRVLRATAGEVQQVLAGQPAWSRLASASAPRLLRIEHASASWAAWVDADKGLQVQRLP